MLATGSWSADGRVSAQLGSGSSNSSWATVLSLRNSQKITVTMDGRASFDAVFLIGIGAYGWDQANRYPMVATIYQRP